jgi:hypothetical protein
VLLSLIVIAWGLEQVALQRVAKTTLSDYLGRCLAIALDVGVVSVIMRASPFAVGVIVAGVLAVHGVITLPLLFAGRQRTRRKASMDVRRDAQKHTPHL